MDGLRSRVAKGAIWVTAARMSSNVLGFAGTIVLARLLTPADFGLVALVTTMVAILSAVTSMSLTEALVQHPAPTRHHVDTSFTLNTVRGLIVAVLFCAAAIPAARIYGEPRITPLALALSTSLLFEGLANPRLGMLMRDLKFRQQFAVQVVQKLVALVISVAVAIVYRSYWALVIGVIVGQFCSTILSYILIPYRPRFCLHGYREMLSFSVWLTLGQIVNTLNWRVDQLLIGGVLGRATLGYYTVGDNLAAMPTREVTMPLTTTLFPALSRFQDTPERLATAYQRAQGLLTSVALPLGVGAALVARPAVELALGTKWNGSILVIQVLGSAFAFQTIASLAQPLGMATGNTRLLFTRDLQQLFIRLPLVVGAMLTWGLPGLLGARAVNACIGIGMNMKIVKEITGLRAIAQLASNYRALISVSAMAGAVLALPQVHAPWALLIERVALGATVYIACHYLLWLLAGRPEGPETDILGLASGFLRKLKRGPDVALADGPSNR